MPRHPVADMIEARLAEMGKKQTWLGQAVAEIEDRPNPYSQAAVSGWLDTITDKHPTLVFSIEKALGLRPGHLSRHLGYLPTEARSVRTVDEALEAEGFPGPVLDVLRSAVTAARKNRG